jgi:hypothetical protein
LDATYQARAVRLGYSVEIASPSNLQAVQVVKNQTEEAFMLVTFRSKAYADITMFGDIAISLLKLMGHSGTVPGAILAEDVPAALDRLNKAIEANPSAADAPDDAQDDDSDECAVNLAHRALPLIELLTAAATEKCDVMWDK